MDTEHDFKQHLVPEAEFRYDNSIGFNTAYNFYKPEPSKTGVIYVYTPHPEYGSTNGTKYVNVEFTDPHDSNALVDMYFDPTDLENLAIFLLYTARQTRKTEGYFNPPTDDDNGFGEL
jgi:hypothetical protein